MKTPSRLLGICVLSVLGYYLLTAKTSAKLLSTNEHQTGSLCSNHGYKTRIFSLDPLVVHITGFVSAAETEHLTSIAEGTFAPSQRVDAVTGKIGGVDTSFRKAETAFLSTDHVTECIQQRAVGFQGHIPGARVEPLQIVRYHLGDFVRNHFDWFSEETVEKFDRFGRRDTSFFFYLHANCTGGGTNFPRLKCPDDDSWGDLIECGKPDEGVTFRAMTGTGLFWQNWHMDGSPRHDVLHSGVPLTEGTKVGMNVWTSGRKVPL